ncbi:hypothetical protein A8W25_19405 [Streptomyces sp. ERV7]|nr:hypothetical protein A8W25_19405 [Streptomyces sp. ERV7]
MTSNDTSGRPGVRDSSVRDSARQPEDSAAVMPDRCSTRPDHAKPRGTVPGDIAEAADPAR